MIDDVTDEFILLIHYYNYGLWLWQLNNVCTYGNSSATIKSNIQ